jgi:acyl carrier protein
MPVSTEIYATVARVLSESLGADEDEVVPEATLQRDLGAESIDFLDIVFRLERAFGIHIPRGELFPESIFGDDPQFIRAGRVTDEGVDLLRSRMPYADLGGLDDDRQLGAVADLFTVDLVVRYVDWKLSQGDTSTNPVTSAVAPRTRKPVSELSMTGLE